MLKMCGLEPQTVLQNTGVTTVIWQMFLLKAVKKKSIIYS